MFISFACAKAIPETFPMGKLDIRTIVFHFYDEKYNYEGKIEILF